MPLISGKTTHKIWYYSTSKFFNITNMSIWNSCSQFCWSFRRQDCDGEHKKSISSIINLQNIESWRRSRETHTILPVHTGRVAIKHTIGHTCELQLIIPIKTNIGRIFWTQFYYCKPSLYFIFTDHFWCAQQTIVFIMHNNLLDSTKGIPILLIPRKWCGCFNLEDWTNLQQKKRKIAL